MKQIKFECKLLSDVVLKSSSATQGISENLDYIPGAKFLGIAAKELYSVTDVNKTMDIFHNGNVQFGDAHICIEGQRTNKAPASWSFKKGEGVGDTIFLHHKLTGKIFQKLSESGIQLKQARKGYFANNQYINTENNFSIKSAYDSNMRKAKDSQMYGYFALPKGSLWEFYTLVDEKYLEDIINALEGKRRIGRSRSAEYGLVDIKAIETTTNFSNINIEAGEVIIYAESNLCFYDEFGQNTVQPTYKQLNLPDNSEILWDKSQIRTRKYQTWNGKRYNRDADRLIIEKGSVFVVKTTKSFNTSVFNNAIGAHKVEGFGSVIINPSFLKSDNEKIELKLHKYENRKEVKYPISEKVNDSRLIDYLISQDKETQRVISIDKFVNEFKLRHIKDFSGITSSQWGQVRNYAKYAANEETLYQLLFAEVTGYFMHGQSEHKWRANNRRWILEEYIYGSTSSVPSGARIEFIQKLASEMGKYVKSKK